MKFGRTGKYYYLRLVRLKGNPRALALGAAIGVFIGLTPTIPFHTVIILILTIITRSSFISALITSWIVCNPLTYIPQYFLALQIGNFVTPYELNWAKVKMVAEALTSNISLAEKVHPLLTMGYEAAVVMLAGGIILATPFAIASYYFFFNAFINFRKKRKERHTLH